MIRLFAFLDFRSSLRDAQKNTVLHSVCYSTFYSATQGCLIFYPAMMHLQLESAYFYKILWFKLIYPRRLHWFLPANQQLHRPDHREPVAYSSERSISRPRDWH